MKRSTRVLATLIGLGLGATTALHAAEPAQAFSSSVSDKGVLIKSEDGNFQFKVKGLLQANYKEFAEGVGAASEANRPKDAFAIRRFRTDFRATFYKVLETRVHSEWASGTGQLLDGTIALSLSDALLIKTGKDKSFIGLERHQSPNYITFPELALPTNLVPNRDLGISASGLFGNNKWEYNVGIFNGVVDLGNVDADADSGKDIAGRLYYLPVKNAGFGGTFSYGNRSGATGSTLLPTYKTPGQSTLFSYASTSYAKGDIYRLSPQGYWYQGPWGIFGEYILSSQAVTNGTVGERLDNTGWLVALNYVWTGETRTFDGAVRPKQNFNSDKGTWGAFETVLRAHELTIDSDAFPTFGSATSFKKATAVGLALNWYPFPVSKITLAVEKAWLKGQGTRTNQDETVIYLQNQIAF